MSRFRLNLLLSGLVGLFACAIVAAFCTWLAASGRLKPPLPFPPVTLLFAIVFGLSSLAELPLMVFAMRRLVVERKSNQVVVLGLNSIYVFFACVYGAPVLLLTGSVAAGLVLCSFSLIRFASSLIFVMEPA